MPPPQSLLAALPISVRSSTRITGGDIHEAYRLLDGGGRAYFLKYPTHPHGAALLLAERRGLALLATAAALPVPRTVAHGDDPAFLLLDYLPPARPDRAAWERLGHGLAALHRHTAAQYGWEHDNFIGTLPQSNRPHADWTAFYREERLLPQLRMGLASGRLNATDATAIERLAEALPDRLPVEPPALLHGDLWSGNYHCTTGGRMYLIDPAVSYGAREMDLALTRLFGGFDAAFYAAYRAAYPPLPGWESRLPIYQLYYLLAHVNMFGGSYVQRTRGLLARIA